MKEYNSKGAIVRNPEDDKLLEEMQKCSYCGGSAYRKIFDKKTWDEHPSMPFKCNYCGDIFCIKCHLPENHNCKNIRPPHTPRKDGKWFTNPDITKHEPKDEVFDNIPKIRPPKVTDKYRSEYIGTTFHNDSVSQDIPKTYPKKSLNWNVIVSILLIIIFSSLLFFVIGNSNSQTTHLTPSNFSNNVTEKIANPAPALTNTSNTTGTLTQSKFKYTYIDSEGNMHEVTDYTSQGGSKYDVIIKNTSVSKSENILIVNKVSENKTEPSKNEDSNFIANLEKQIVGWWDDTKPKAEFNSATYDIENIVFNKVNEERSTQGLHALIWDSKLAEVARLHSLDMANRSYFSHENPEGEDPTMRAIRNGYNVHKELGNGWYSDGIGENIGMMPTGNVQGYGYVSSSKDIADAMMQSWMNSPGHRANILKADYNFIGVGVAYNGYGTYYLTQDFK